MIDERTILDGSPCKLPLHRLQEVEEEHEEDIDEGASCATGRISALPLSLSLARGGGKLELDMLSATADNDAAEDSYSAFEESGPIHSPLSNFALTPGASQTGGSLLPWSPVLNGEASESQSVGI